MINSLNTIRGPLDKEGKKSSLNSVAAAQKNISEDFISCVPVAKNKLKATQYFHAKLLGEEIR